MVALREDGQYAVLDGQHRAEAARQDAPRAMTRAGKKAAGHRLDGREHWAWPETPG